MSTTAERELTRRPTSITLYPRQDRELTELRAWTGLHTTELIRQAIDEMHERRAAQQRKAS